MASSSIRTAARLCLNYRRCLREAPSNVVVTAASLCSTANASVVSTGNFDGGCGGNQGLRQAAYAAAAAAASAAGIGFANRGRHVHCDEQTTVPSSPSGTSLPLYGGKVHPLLEKHYPRVVAGMDKTNLSALVPLCGKHIDSIFLAEQGLQVVGVEAAAGPVTEFRLEQRRRLKGFKKPSVLSLTAEGWVEGQQFEPSAEFNGRRPNWVFKLDKEGLGYYTDTPQLWRGKVVDNSEGVRSLDIIQSDFFQLTPDLVRAATSAEDGIFDVVYDRAAICMLAPSSRQRYAEMLSKLLRPDGRILIITVDCSSEPRIHLPIEELRRLFPSPEWVCELLEDEPEVHKEMIGKRRTLTLRSSAVLITKGNASTSDGGSAKTKYFIGAATLGAVAVAAWLLSGSGSLRQNS